jgi:glutamine---fructose-6-phosphate transaminase (isomerizing)
MCGIFGYIGPRPALKILLAGLHRLEYRGYDSAGIALAGDDCLRVIRAKGSVAALESKALREEKCGRSPPLRIGIAHTRWATHGAPSVANAHPHVDASGRIAVVHNGIIENADALRKVLAADGVVFKSETDTEVIPHLIAKYFRGDLAAAVRRALRDVDGTYGILALRAGKREIVATRRGSPMVLGIGEGEHFIASDPTAIGEHTRRVLYIEDGDLLVVREDGYDLDRLSGRRAGKAAISTIDWDIAAIEKGGCEHFMLKEIREQPEALRNACRGRLLIRDGTVKFGGLNLSDAELRGIDRIIPIACGTSWHASLVGEYYFEGLAGLDTTVEYATEFQEKKVRVTPSDCVLAVSQSGETADTLLALRHALRQGARTLGLVNAVGSTIARETEGGVYLHVGPEIGVASTKAFTGQLAAMYMLAVRLGRVRGALTAAEGRRLLKNLEALPEAMEQALADEDVIKRLARRFKDSASFLFMGRGMQYPVALEGALKMKEISYIHAEGISASEMKHGPIALVDHKMPCLFLCSGGPSYEKVMSNIREVRARRGIVIAVAGRNDRRIAAHSDVVIRVPDVDPWLAPIVNAIPLQLLAYHTARLRGCSIDKPRNLAKSVTVE